jgi:hypothetical protein
MSLTAFGAFTRSSPSTISSAAFHCPSSPLAILASKECMHNAMQNLYEDQVGRREIGGVIWRILRGLTEVFEICMAIISCVRNSGSCIKLLTDILLSRNRAHDHRRRLRAVRPAAIYAGAPAKAEIARDGGGGRAQFNAARDDIFENSTRRGLDPEAQFELSPAYQEDRLRGWSHGATADAHFSRDQNFFEANIGRLKTPVKVMWGEKDVFINPGMGAELAQRIGVAFHLLPGVGHYPHLQDPQGAAGEVRASFR